MVSCRETGETREGLDPLPSFDIQREEFTLGFNFPKFFLVR